MNIYAGISPVVHLIQCVFHSHFPLIYFIPWAPIGNDLSWLCLPGICHEESWLLPTLQQPVTIKREPQKSSPASLHPCFPTYRSITGSPTAPLGFTDSNFIGERRSQLVGWDRTNGPASEEMCLPNTNVMEHLKLHREKLNFNLESNLQPA